MLRAAMVKVEVRGGTFRAVIFLSIILIHAPPLTRCIIVFLLFFLFFPLPGLYSAMVGLVLCITMVALENVLLLLSLLLLFSNLFCISSGYCYRRLVYLSASQFLFGHGGTNGYLGVRPNDCLGRKGRDGKCPRLRNLPGPSR